MDMASGVVSAALSHERMEKVRQAVETWKAQLVDMTGRNQLLFYRDLKIGTLSLEGASDAALKQLLAGRCVTLEQLMPSTEAHPGRQADTLKRARRIHAKAVELFEERGIETLFLAYGTATWQTEQSSSTPRAPVLLRPVSLTAKGSGQAKFDVELSGDWEVNETLVHRMQAEFQVGVDGQAMLDTVDLDAVGTPDASRLFERLAKECAEVPAFGVNAEVFIGTFAYLKLPMVRDLESSLEALAEHDIIAAIAGDEDAAASVRELHARDVDPSLPDHTPPADEFLIVDADASQNAAINAALGGEPLIVQGPPGTGKSQTIANLISASTARGERVLFVAEKRAAIDAVTKRLRRQGLGDLVMDLHGGAMSKRELAASLAESLEQTGRIPEVDMSRLHRELETNREALNSHVAAMHESRRPWEMSFFDVSAELLRIPDEAKTNVRFAGQRLSSLDDRTAEQARTLLAEWAELAVPIIEATTPWAGAAVTSPDEAQAALEVVSDLAAETVPTAREHLERVLADTSLPSPDTVAGWQATLALLSALSVTLATVSDDLFELNLEALETALEPGARSWWSRLVAQLFNGAYRDAKKELRSVWTGDDKPSGSTAYETVRAAADQLAEWRDLGGSGTPRFPSDLDGASTAYDELSSELAALGAYLVARDLTATNHRQVGDEVQALVADQATLFALPRIHEIETWARSFALAPLLDDVRAGNLDRQLIVEAFDFAWLSSIRTHVLASDKRLSSFNGKVQDTRVQTFVDRDVDHLDKTAARVLRRVAVAARDARDANFEQDQLIKAQAKRSRGHLPLRKLFEKAPDVLTALRPCWAMSPLVVAQTLPAEQLFDLVIFDEASQVTPADAISAILRGKRVVVAGDDKQLPPTSFFGAVPETDDDEDDDTLALTSGYESILDVLGAMLRPYMLTWHYRSSDERLISFSNHQFYKAALTTFPGVAGHDVLRHELVPHRPGVKLDTRSNDDEVARVVELMLQHARTRPHETLGVIAMGLHHADRVDAALRRALQDQADPALESFFDETREERAFVKNLERVQGDERDAIILTVGYGKQPDGRLLYRFGPLNGEQGPRRLNVAVTRARRRLTVVSSFSHTDMKAEGESSAGAELLRSYLKYAESGGTELGSIEVEHPLNPFELSVLSRLEAAGLDVHPQYGSSGFRIDFAVCHPTEPGRMVLAIEADGASYHSSQTARDRDRLRQQVLETVGWRFHRIWSTDWFNDPDAETAKILVAYNDALDQPAEPAGTPEPVADDVMWEFETPKPSGPRPRIQTGLSITQYSHKELVKLARWIASDTLPRTQDEIVALMMDELGFKRRGSRIMDALAAAAREAAN